MTEDGPELVQLVDGAVVWPPFALCASTISQPKEAQYEILVGRNTIRLVSAKCARSNERR